MTPEQLEFIKQIARLTLPQEEFDASQQLQDQYDDADDYECDLDEDYLLDQHYSLKGLIEKARELTQ